LSLLLTLLGLLSSLFKTSAELRLENDALPFGPDIRTRPESTVNQAALTFTNKTGKLLITWRFGFTGTTG
jgi:hypothetical protein